MKTLRTVFSVFLAFVLTLLLLPLTALAATSGDYEYSVCGGNATITRYIGSAINLSIPETLGGYPVTSIGDIAFEYCRSLINITIPSSVISIGYGAFSHCSSLTSVTIPSSVTSIGYGAFSHCSSLTSVTIPGSVTSIGSYAFAYCTSLTSVTIPSSVTSIGDYAFFGCSSLTSVTIPSSVTSIGDAAFTYCFNMTAITVAAANTAYASEAGMLYNKAKTTLILCPEGKSGSITIPNSVTSIGDKAFYYCRSLTSVTIPNSVTSIGDYAFYVCSSLTNVTIPSSVTSIGTWAFSNCGSLTSITIPSSVTSIGTWTFSGCGSLTSITIPSSVTSIGTCAFIECTSLTSAYFYGNAPSMGSEVFYICAPGFTVYYISGKTGWTTPTWNGYNTAAWSGNTADVSSVMVDGKNVLAEKVTYAKPGTTNFVSISANWNENKPGLYQLVQNNITKYTSSSGSFSLNIANTLTAGADVYLKLVNSTGAIVKTIKTGIVVAEQNIGNEISEKLGTFKSLPGDDKASDRTYDYRYSDLYFKGSSYTYKHDLAKMSLNLALAAFNASDADWKFNSDDKGYHHYIAGYNIFTLMSETGFNAINTSLYEGKPEPTQNPIGAAFGKKYIVQDGEVYTLIAIAIRGGGYEREWAGNFMITGSNDHKGFSDAAKTVKTALLKYIRDYKVTGKVKVWISGYSRGAATANLVAASLDDGFLNSETSVSLQREDIYAYTFETPQNTKSTQESKEKYFNIFNIINPIDPVTKVAMKKWGYSRYGVNLYLPSAATSSNIYNASISQVESIYKRLTGVNHVNQIENQGMTLDSLMDKAASLLDTDNSPKTQVLLYVLQKAVLINFDLSDNALLKISLQSLASHIITEFGLIPGALAALAAGNVAQIVVQAHYPELCYAWMNTVTGIEGYNGGKARMLGIKCPVDVNIYDSGNNLVASVIDHVVQEVPGSYIGAFVDENNQIKIALPPDEEYRIEVTATDNGLVDYSIGEYSLEDAAYDRVINYYDIPVSEGDVLTGTAPNIEGVAMRSMRGSNDYQLTASESDAITPSIDLSGGQIEHFSVAVTVDGNGAVAGAGQVLVGDYVTLTAAPNGSDTFIGWYNKADNLLSTDSEYRIRAESDISITAKFTGVLVIPEIYDIWISGVDYDSRQAVTGALDITLALINAGTMDISSVDVTVVGDHLDEVYNETLPCSLGAESYGKLEINIDIPQLESAESYTIAVNPNSNANDSANNIVNFTLGEFDLVINSSDYLDQGVYMSDVTITNFGGKTNAILRIHADDADGDVLFEQSLGDMAMGDNQSLTIDLDGLVAGVDVSALYAVVSSPVQSESRLGDNVTILAHFVPAVTNEDSYTLTVTGGIGSGDYAEGVVVIIVADEAPNGQQFKEWNISPSVTFADGTSAANTTAKFTMPDQAVTATAVYEPIPPTTYAVTVTNGTGGGSYAAGAEVTITANTAPSGQQFKEWNISPSVTFADGTSAANTTAKFTMPDQAVTATAVYEPIPPTTYAVTVTNGTGGGNYAAGTEVTITANTAPSGQQFKQWNISPSVTFADGTSAVSTTAKFTMPDQAVTATAAYEPIPPTTIAVTSVGLSPTSASLKVGQTQQLTATVSPANATNKAVTYSSSNENVATVSGTGLVTTKGVGTATITVKTNDGNKTATCSIMVAAPIVGSYQPGKLPTKAFKETAVTVQKVAGAVSQTMTSSNSKVITVNGDTLEFVGAGKAKVTVKYQLTNAKTGKITTKTVTKTITVTSKVKEISLNKTSATIAKKGKVTLTAFISPSDATTKTVTWSTSNKKVATVTSKGVVAGIGVGTCTITAKTKDGGYIASAAITVTPIYETAIKLNKTSASLKKGKTLQLKASLTPSSTDFKMVTWTSDNPNVAKVDAKGKVTAVQTGTCIITATSANGKTATCKMTTLPQKVTSVKMGKVTTTQFAGNTVKIPLTVGPSTADNRAVTWTSSNSNIATVDQYGNVTFHAGGKVTIKAMAQDGSKKSTSKKFTVKQPVSGISLNTSDISIAVKQIYTLKAIVTPSTATNKAVTWTSGNIKIATVSSSGVVKGVSRGTVIITCRAKDGSGIIAQCTVIVN
ncbi:MAG: leucine-rich repeat protein [Christensenellales bacterium]